MRVEQLLAAIAVATARSADLRRANEALQTRKVVERAKGLLMK
ncbi:MAG TPA: ANTAR domain-containing protein [bacterium]|nr:ANTAR domain-containing protein [bacterium]